MTQNESAAGPFEGASKPTKRRRHSPRRAARPADGEPQPGQASPPDLTTQTLAPPEAAPVTPPVTSAAAPPPTSSPPARSASTPPVDVRPVQPSNPAGRSLRRTAPPPILVATAEPSLSRMLSFALEQLRLPYRLLESGSVVLREMLDMKIVAQPPIVLLDVDLPGVDGHAILERIGVKRPDAFLILVLSSHADESVQVRSLLAGAVDHLAKPFNVRVLMAKIQRWNAMAAHLAGAA